MVKDLAQRNRKHTTKRDRKGQRERSKEEHMKKKAKDLAKKPTVLDEMVQAKLVRIVKDLIGHSEEVKKELPGVAEMLDTGHEVDVTDIEDLFVREKLERLLELFEGFVERVEAEDGTFSFKKVSEEPLKDQITQLIMRATEGQKREQWMNSMTDTLASEFGPSIGPSEDSSYGPSSKKAEKDSQAEIDEYIEAYNKEYRPKSLMEIHMANRKSTKQPSAVLYGHKHISKRFVGGRADRRLP